MEKFRVHLNDKFSSQVLSPSSALSSSQRSVVSHRRVGGFSDSSFLGLYSVDKVSSEFSFSVPRLVVFGKHIKSVGRRVGIDFSEPWNGGAKTCRHLPTRGMGELRECGLPRTAAGGRGGPMKEPSVGFKERLMSLCAPSSSSSSSAPTAEVCVTYSRSTPH